MKHRITQGSILDDLGLDQAEAQNLTIRAVLMREIEQQIKEHGWTQVQSAKALGVAQPRVSDLVRGKIERFTIDMLVKMLAKCGVPVSLVIDDRIAA